MGLANTMDTLIKAVNDILATMIRKQVHTLIACDSTSAFQTGSQNITLEADTKFLCK